MWMSRFREMFVTIHLFMANLSKKLYFRDYFINFMCQTLFMHDLVLFSGNWLILSSFKMNLFLTYDRSALPTHLVSCHENDENTKWIEEQWVFIGFADICQVLENIFWTQKRFINTEPMWMSRFCENHQFVTIQLFMAISQKTIF